MMVIVKFLVNVAQRPRKTNRFSFSFSEHTVQTSHHTNQIIGLPPSNHDPHTH